jgi:hypothetical protein
MLNTADFTLPQEEEMGATFEIDSFGGRNPVTKQSRIRESRKRLPPDTESYFNDTFQETPTIRQRRLREASVPTGQAQFSRGVPTNDKTSADNYDNDDIIDGEHKTLTVLGRINEAMEGDDHNKHIFKHRMLLSDPKLSETRRVAIMEHIKDHMDKQGKKLKAIDAAKKGESKDRPDIMKNRGYGHGVGMLSKAVKPRVMSVIPQDDAQSNERKRTAGNMSMESKMRNFDRALRTSRRRGL